LRPRSLFEIFPSAGQLLLRIHVRANSSDLKLVRLGNQYRDAGDWARAEETYRHAIRANQRSRDAWAELGCLLSDSRRFSEAVACFRKIGTIATPSISGAHETVCRLEDIVARRPHWARGQFSLGCAYEHLGEYERARVCLAKALQLDSTRKAAVQALFARMLLLERRWSEAVSAAERALEANSEYYLAHVIRGKACSALGLTAEAQISNRRSLEILPDRAIHSDLLFDMNYLADSTPESMYAEAGRWNSLYAAPLASGIVAHANSRDPDRRIRIGYVSPDVHQHTIMKFLLPVFEHHDRSQFDVFVYAISRKSDHIADVTRSLTNYVSIDGQAYQELAGRVRRDEIDILVDLAGHSMGPALLAFALKPAPVQISWMGYAGTSGLNTMDYFMGDSEMPCPGTDLFFSEKVYRLPRVECCYRPNGNVPISPAPCLERGFITFGCFNNPRKITRDAVALWAAILHLVPESRLLLKFRGLDSEDRQSPLQGWFEQDGIRKERVAFEGFSEPSAYLEAYNGIDISLDPFPYNGSTTTLDSLWMGVPVISLAGRPAVQRAGASILTAAGWPDLVAKTPEQYLKIAQFLALAIPREPGLRNAIRQSLINSPWMDEVGVVREVEAAYRDMWRSWCNGGH
jgi:protein O-GlcNAc transferase